MAKHVEHEHGDGHKHAPVHHVHGDVGEIHHHHHREGGRAEHEHERRARGGATHMTHGGHRIASSGHELETMGDMPEPPHERHGGRAHEAHGGHPGHPHDTHHPETHHRRRARGGKAGDDSDGEAAGGGKLQVYNAKGSKEVEDAEDEKPEFSRGGHPKRKRGGHAEGEMARPRLDRRPRRAQGGRSMGADHSPYSSAATGAPPADDIPGRGYEGREKRT